jgi:hypothetical protein
MGSRCAGRSGELRRTACLTRYATARVKALLYLSDVTSSEHGPFAMLQNYPQVFNKDGYLQPDEERLPICSGTDGAGVAAIRFLTEHVLAELRREAKSNNGTRAVEVHAPAGTVILFDVTTIHTGMPISNASRTSVTNVYTVNRQRPREGSSGWRRGWVGHATAEHSVGGHEDGHAEGGLHGRFARLSLVAGGLGGGLSSHAGPAERISWIVNVTDVEMFGDRGHPADRLGARAVRNASRTGREVQCDQMSIWKGPREWAKPRGRKAASSRKQSLGPSSSGGGG